METYDFKNEIIDKNGNKINILDAYNFNKIKRKLHNFFKEQQLFTKHHQNLFINNT